MLAATRQPTIIREKLETGSTNDLKSVGGPGRRSGGRGRPTPPASAWSPGDRSPVVAAVRMTRADHDLVRLRRDEVAW